MNEPEWRDLSCLRSQVIKTEEDLEKLADCVDRRIFSYGFDSEYCETGSAGLYWTLRSIGESIGVHPDLKFCDIGFGSGTILATFAALGYRTYGIDMRDQPLKHAPEFFKRVQERFGKFKHQPQLIPGRISPGGNDWTFPDSTKIGDMDLYYAYINDEPGSLPILMELISPKKGSFAIHNGPYFQIPEGYTWNPENLNPDGSLNFATYKGLGYRLANADKQRLDDPLEKDKMGLMEEAYRPIFVKE